MEPEEIEMVLVKLEDRARSLGLRAKNDPEKETDRLIDVASLVTAMVVQFNNTGDFSL